MNSILKMALGTLLLAETAFASVNGPLVVKSSGGGHTPREWSNFETCEVYQNKVVVTHSYAAGDVVAKEVHAISISGSLSLLQVILKTLTEEVESRENMMCDAPSTSIVAKDFQTSESINDVVLFSSGGCGSPRLERQGAYSHILRSLVEIYCPKTNDFGGN